MHEGQVPVLTGTRKPADVLAAVAAHGVALLRDGGWQRDTFVALGDALMEPVPYADGFHQERDVIGDDRTTTTVTRGTRGMPLHREASYAPGSPDLLTFLCERPAADGGRTTLCDGVALLAALPPEARAEFEQLEIVWENALPDGEWQRAFGTDDPAAVRLALRQWEPYLRPWESVRVHATDTALVTGFGTRCTPPTLFGGVPAFCNSLFISRPDADEYHDQRLRVRTASGAPVPAGLLSVAAEAARRLTVTVPWQAGDVLVVDNSRYLHGRQAFTDTGRSVMVRMGHLHLKETA
ncbi:TauD/TfdA family dioxygenase [Micromonospora sp. NPDC048170]|uniref:TauD/TfdA family dioxygenase n=1 Tax=Micromonospora sp. NPDC048170 TaxID=3154819 RepID=UPI0033D0DBB9